MVAGAGAGSGAAAGGESITLADIKVGDTVAGQGALKNGVFVPTELGVMDAAAMTRRRRSARAVLRGALARRLLEALQDPLLEMLLRLGRRLLLLRPSS